MKQGMTMAEKALAKASGRDVVRPGEFATAGTDALIFNEISFYEATENMDQIGRDEVWDPDKIVEAIGCFFICCGFQKIIVLEKSKF